MRRSPAQRIVSLISSATEILFAIGAGNQVVGISHECDYPAEAQDRPRLTRSHINSDAASADIDTQVQALKGTQAPLYELDADRLSDLQPDLIITQSQCDVCAVDYREVLRAVRSDGRLLGTQIIDLNPQSLPEVFGDILRIGEAVGRAGEANRFLADLQDRVRRIVDANATLPAPQRPRTAVIEWIEPLMLAANWTPDLVRHAGGQNGLSTGGQHSQYATWDAVRHYDPEVIVVAPCGFRLDRTIAESQTLASRPEWRELTAVRTERVFALDGNAYLNRSGPRLVETLEILTCLLQPDRFPELPARLPRDAYRRLTF